MRKYSTNGSVVSAAVLLGVSSLGSRVVGLLRERALTTAFGAGDVFDAFVAAFRLPDLIFNVIVVGALSAAFIPLFTEKLVNNKRAKNADAFEFANSILNVVLLIVVVLSVVYVVLAEQLVPLITPGFTGEKLSMTIMLSRIMALQPILLAISFVFSGMLNSFKRFVVYALAPILYNVGIIIGVVWLVPRMGIDGLAWGVVLGAAFHMLIQLPSAWQVGWRWRPVLRWSSADVTTLRKMILPRMFGLSSQQVNLFLVTILGSTLAAGSITVFHLANNVQSVPVGIFGIAFAQAAFPSLAEQVARKQTQAFRNTLTRSFRYILFFVIPATVFFWLLRAQMIRVLFGAGKFDWEDTILTFETFGLLLMSLFAQATIPLLIRAFYVRHNTLIPVVISLISIVFNVVVALMLVGSMGVQGLAIAFSAAAILQLMLLLSVLHWQLGGFNDREVLVSLARISVAAFLGGLVLQLLKYPVANVVDMQRFWGIFTQLVVASAGGLATYLVCMWLFGSDEIRALRQYLPGRAQLKLSAGADTSRFEGMGE
jgi:putative peptidoglycan lipid II flippase